MSARREGIDGSLAECPHGGWIATEEFFRYMQATGNDFAVTRDAWALYICDQQYGSLGYEGGARILNERYLLSPLLEYPATLRMIVAVLTPPPGARRAFRRLLVTQ